MPTARERREHEAGTCQVGFVQQSFRRWPFFSQLSHVPSNLTLPPPLPLALHQGRKVARHRLHQRIHIHASPFWLWPPTSPPPSPPPGPSLRLGPSVARPKASSSSPSCCRRSPGLFFARLELSFTRGSATMQTWLVAATYFTARWLRNPPQICKIP